MPFRTAAQLFGDNAGNGAQVPFSTTNPPGTGANNRGIQFGESLTSSISNRPHYALALNDENLNSRIVSFETDGLDAAYRLGSIASAGGGRIITVDGGPVELQSVLTTYFEDDRFNAALRIDMEPDVLAGAVGLEVRSNYAAFPLAEIVTQAIQNLTGQGITGVPSDPGVLNEAGAGAASLFLDGSDTALGSLQGCDVVEILDSAHAGTYTVFSYDTASASLVLRALNGSTPSFTSDTAVTYRIWRNFFRSTHRADSTNTGRAGGTLIVGGVQYDDTATLSLAPGVRAPTVGTGVGTFDTSGVGSRYALRVLSTTGTDGVMTPSFRIDAAGIPRAGNQPTNYLTDFMFYPGYYHQGGSSRLGGFVSYDRSGNQTYGMVSMLRRGASIACTLNGAALTGAASRVVAPGQLLEVTAPSTHIGIYRVLSCTNPAAWFIQTLDGVDATFANSAATCYLLEGVYSGRSTTFSAVPAYTIATNGAVTNAEDEIATSLHVVTPISGSATVSATGILIGMAQVDNAAEAAYLRCLAAQDAGDDFAVLNGGTVWAKESFQAVRMVANAYQWDSLKTIIRTQNSLLAKANTAGQWTTSAVPQATADSAVLRYPLTDLEQGATITEVSIPHSTNTARAGGNRAFFQIVKQAYSATSTTNIGASTPDDGTGGGGGDIVISGLSEVIDLATYQYQIVITAGVPFDDAIHGPVKVAMTTRNIIP